MPTNKITEGKKRQLQAQLIALLSAGVPRKTAAKSVGVAYSTANRWQSDDPQFVAALNAEIDRRQRVIEDSLRAATDRQIEAEANELAEELGKYRKALINVQLQRLNLGKRLGDKASRRLSDLPDEALSPSDAVRLLAQADALIEKGLQAWSDALAVGELLEHFGVGNNEV